MYGLLYLMKKYLYKYDNSASTGLKIKVLSLHTILPKKYICVVRIHDKNYVLGISENSINVIDEIENLEIKEEKPTSFGTGNFMEILKKNMGLKNE
jgi:flagellar biogenesis protein FliO